MKYNRWKAVLFKKLFFCSRLFVFFFVLRDRCREEEKTYFSMFPFTQQNTAGKKRV